MTKIFVESKHDNTTETVFLKTLLQKIGIEETRYKIIHVDGKDNLKNNENIFVDNTLSGGRNVIIFDADTPDTQAGFEVTRNKILKTFPSDVKIDGLFLFPNNQDDGIFENLLEEIMQKENHQLFIDCFSDYEHCLGDKYVSPDLKGKLHTYMSAQKALSKTQRKRLGSGQWLFEDSRYWNLDSDYLTPLKTFLLEKI